MLGGVATGGFRTVADRLERDLVVRIDVFDDDLDFLTELSTSSTLSMRLPPPILEMCRPSRPGRMFTNAPNLVMFTTRPAYWPRPGGRRVEDQFDLLLGLGDLARSVLDGHDADHAVVVDGDVGAGLTPDGVETLPFGPMTSPILSIRSRS